MRLWLPTSLRGRFQPIFDGNVNKKHNEYKTRAFPVRESESTRDRRNQRRFFRQQACEIDLANLGRGLVAVAVCAQHCGVDGESGGCERATIRLNAGIRLERVAELAAPQPRQREQGAMG